VLTFNITLSNYVRDLMHRARPYPHDVAIITHFHEFCSLALTSKSADTTPSSYAEYFDTILPNALKTP